MDEPSGSSGYRERTFTCRHGLRLYFRDYGDPLSTAPAVLCLGGLTRNSKDFHGLARRLARHRRVLCPDYRGRGRSDPDPDWRRYRPETYLDDIRQLLTAANVHRVVTIGTSLGGILAMALAVAGPTLLAGAVLNDIGPEIEMGGLAPLIADIRDARPMPDWDSAMNRLKSVYPDLPANNDAEWMTIARATYRERPEGGIVFDWDPAIVKPLLRDPEPDIDLWPMFRALGRVPVVAVRGGRSNILREESFQRMAEALPNIVTVTVPGVGHAPSLGEPSVVESIDDLVSRT